MANSDKNIKITPNISQTAQPNVVFTGQGAVPITLKVLDDSYGTLSFEGSAGQLFSVNNNLSTGVIFSVNDISGIPQIDVNANGTVRLVPFGGVVGVGTSSPVSTSPGVDITADASSQLTGQLMIKRASTNDRMRLTLGMHTSNYGFIQAYENAIGGLVLALQPSSGTVGIGVTAPGAKLQIDTTAAATKGLIVKGFTSQSANAFEYQNSAGTVLTNIDSAGNLTVSAVGNANLTFSNSTTARWILYHDSATGYFHLRDIVWDGVSRLMVTPGGNFVLGNAGGDQTNGPKLLVTTGPDTTGNTGAARKGIIVKGSASQSANLTEWQNSAGTALATVDPAGNFYTPGGSLAGTSNAGGAFIGVSKWLGMDGTYIWIRKLYGTRTFPATNATGDYVEIVRIGRNTVNPITLTVHGNSGAVYGSQGKIYTIFPDFSNASPGWVAAPSWSKGINSGLGYSDFEIEVVAIDSNYSAIRARRTVATTPSIDMSFMFTVEMHNYNSGYIASSSVTGNSATALAYASNEHKIGPYVCSPPPVNGSGAGTNLTIAASSGSGTGSGGSIILQAGAQAGGASVGGSISLVPSVSPANYAASYVGIGYLSGFTPSHYTFQRTLPDAVGDYVELFSFEGQHGSWFEVTLVENKHAEAYGAKSYKFAAQYLVGNAILQPDFNHAENPGFASFFSNNYELELIAASDPATLRIRRTASGGTSVIIYAYVKAMIFSGLTEKTGTGTSAVALTSLHSTQLYSPTIIQPMRMPGNSGAGFNLMLRARDGLSSGAGGSIILQPGAQATSGGNGVVVVRQPGGTAGTDEIQLLHDGSKGSLINKDGALQLGGANIAIRNVANNANTTLTATTLYATGIYSSDSINADGVTNDSYSWAIDGSSLNWNQGFNLRVGWSHIKGAANLGLAYTGNNTNGRRATLEVTDGSTGGGALAYRSATTTVNTSYNDLNLTGHSAFQRLNATAATTITGIAPASTAGGSGFPTWIHTDGRIFWLYNVGTFNITLANESASSTAGNRIITQTGANVILGPGMMMQIVYDGTSSRWRTSGETTINALAAKTPVSTDLLEVADPTTGVAGQSTVQQVYRANIPAVSITFTGTAPPPFGALISPPGGAQSGSTLTFSSGVTVETFVYSNGASTTLTISNLASVRSTFTMSTWPSLTSLSFPALNSVGVNFGPSAMSSVTTLSLPVLTFVGSTFNPSGMAITTLNLPALAYVGGIFGLGNFTSLATLSTPALATVMLTCAPSTMNALTTLSFPALTYIGDTFNPNTMSILTTMSIPVLEFIGGSFQPSTLAALTTLSATALKSVGVNFGRTVFSNGNISPLSMGSLATLTFPAIEVIGAQSSASISITSGTAALTTFTLGSTLLRVEGNVIMSSCALNQASVDGVLVRLAALNGTGGTTTYSSKTVTITGTSATPSATGLSAKSTLVSRGCTVTHN